MPRLLFNFDGLTLAAETLHTPTAAAIVAALPLEGRAQTWGDEVYFGIDVSVRPEKDVRPLIEAGETAYWPDGEAIAIGFGRTPISAPGEIRLATPCNIWAKAIGVRNLKPVHGGSRVTVALKA